MPRADSLLAATRCGRASEWLGLAPGGVISVARAGLDTGKRFSVGCRVLRGFLAALSSAIRSGSRSRERWLGVESWASEPTGAGGGCRRALFEGLIVCRRAYGAALLLGLGWTKSLCSSLRVFSRSRTLRAEA